MACVDLVQRQMTAGETDKRERERLQATAPAVPPPQRASKDSPELSDPDQAGNPAPSTADYFTGFLNALEETGNLHVEIVAGW